MMADQLMTDFAIQASSFGLLTACYYYVYSFLQIPVGVFLDRFGPKKVLRVAVILCTLGALLFSCAHNFWIAALGRSLIGAGAASAFLGTVCVSTLWFPPEKLAFVVGLTIALGKLGGMSSNLPLAMLMEVLTWRETLLVLVMVGFALAILIWWLMRDRPKGHTVSPKQPIEDWGQIISALKVILKHDGIWRIALYGCLMYVPLTVFADVWGISFLMHVNHMERATASIGVMMVFIGSAMGAPLIALLSNAWRKRRAPMIFSALFSIFVSSIVVFVPDLSTGMVFMLLFLVGLSMTGQTLVFVSGCEEMPPHMSGMVSGILNMVVMMGGVVFQPLTGWLIDFFWDGTLKGGLPLYQASDYRLALTILPLSAFVSLLLTPFLPETHPEQAPAKSPVISGET